MPKHLIKMKWQKLVIYMLIYWVVCIISSDYIGINTTESKPKGYYLYYSSSSYRVGDLVLICVVDTIHINVIKKFGVTSDVQDCSGSIPYLLKTVIAKAGDVISINKNGISVNNKLFKNSQSLVNYHGINLLPQPYGVFTLKTNEFFVLGDSKNSYDSRYFGVVRLAQIKHKAFFLMPMFF